MSSLAVGMNRPLCGFIFMKQRLILILVILVFPNGGGQKQGKQCGQSLKQ